MNKKKKTSKGPLDAPKIRLVNPSNNTNRSKILRFAAKLNGLNNKNVRDTKHSSSPINDMVMPFIFEIVSPLISSITLPRDIKRPVNPSGEKNNTFEITHILEIKSTINRFFVNL